MENGGDNIGNIKGSWTPDEDAMLRFLVEENGPREWSKISSGIPGRTGKSCRLRWCNQLSPGVLHGPFTPEEDMVIFNAHLHYGNKWSTIARFLPGRTDNAIKNHWNSALRNKRNRETSVGDPFAVKRPCLNALPAISPLRNDNGDQRVGESSVILHHLRTQGNESGFDRPQTMLTLISSSELFHKRNRKQLVGESSTMVSRHNNNNRGYMTGDSSIISCPLSSNDSGCKGKEIAIDIDEPDTLLTLLPPGMIRSAPPTIPAPPTISGEKEMPVETQPTTSMETEKTKKEKYLLDIIQQMIAQEIQSYMKNRVNGCS